MLRVETRRNVCERSAEGRWEMGCGEKALGLAIMQP
jgi:hypothetical protein